MNLCWADRATLILGIIWAAFLLLLFASNASSGGWGWIEGMLFLFATPMIVVWIVLRLVLGRRGLA